MKYIVGNTGRLAQYLVGKTDGTLIKPTECTIIPAKSKVLYTSAFTANFSTYISSPLLVLNDNVKHLQNIFNLLERGCDIIYTGSDQGYYLDGHFVEGKSAYSYAKLYISHLAEVKYDVGSITNLIIPSIIGRDLYNSQQLFEDVILRAIKNDKEFMKTYLQNAKNNKVKSFVTIEDLDSQLNTILAGSFGDGGNILIEPTFTETISSFYKSVSRVLIERKEPISAIENYILEKVKDHEVSIS